MKNTGHEEMKNGHSEWIRTKDNFRIRVAFWPKEDALGTVLIFPGRNEYIEKYGRTSKKIWELGYSSLVVDWRGQGLSGRLTKDKHLGHVDKFEDYDSDLLEIFDNIITKCINQPTFTSLYIKFLNNSFSLISIRTVTL